MNEQTPRIAILGRPGPAREHLRHALAELGGDIITEGDPAELNAADVLDARPSVVVVSLDAAMEEQLEAWDALIYADDISVIFDEAETTGRLDGWDLARWARHLAAKILGHEQTLPPTPEGAEQLPGPVDWIPSPGGPVTPAVQMDAERFEDYTGDSVELASRVPVGDIPNGTDMDAGAPDAVDDGEPMPTIGESSAAATNAQATSDEPLGAVDGASVVDDGLEVADDLDSDFRFEVDGDPDGDPDEDPAGAVLEPDDGAEVGSFEGFELEPTGDRVDAGERETTDYGFSGLEEDAGSEDDLDADVAALAAQMDSFQTDDAERDAPDLSGLELEEVGEAPEAGAIDERPAERDGHPPDTDGENGDATSPTRAEPAKDFSFGRPLSLLGEDEEAPPPVDEQKPTPALSIDALAAAFQLESTEEEFAQQGVVVLLAGMGGPDALRQFLSALEPGFPVPVLVWQQLNAGTHDRLASQLGKTGKVTTYVAAVGAPMPSGEVGILPPEIGVSASGGLHFVKEAGGPARLLSGLAPLGERAVVVALSGSEMEWMQGVAEWVETGGTILAQDPDTCFEGSTCRELAENGYRCATPANLAVDALSRWYEEY